MPRLREPRCFPYFADHATIGTDCPKAAAPCCVPSAPSQTGSVISVYQAVAVALGLQALHWHLGCRDALFSPHPGGLRIQEDIHAGNDWRTMLAHSRKEKCSTGGGSPERHVKAMEVASSLKVLRVWNSACFALWPWDQDKRRVSS